MPAMLSVAGFRVVLKATAPGTAGSEKPDRPEMADKTDKKNALVAKP
ncbi:MAG: hypothetical protein HQL86_09670 [Magnetococcales bacterium]|nr:hypothetical protein [Magnetococcales bacterium]